MSGVGFDMKDVNKTQPVYPAINRAILFIIPSVVITTISMILFSQLKGFSETQINVFSITIISAVILSLIGMSAMQLIIYRIVDDREYFKDGASIRAIKMGIVYTLILSLIISAILYPFFTLGLGFSLTRVFVFCFVAFDVLSYLGFFISFLGFGEVCVSGYNLQHFISCNIGFYTLCLPDRACICNCGIQSWDSCFTHFVRVYFINGFSST